MVKYARFHGFASVNSFTLVHGNDRGATNNQVIEQAEYNTNGVWRNPACITIDDITLEVENDWNALKGDQAILVNSTNPLGHLYAVELYSNATVEIPLEDEYDNLDDETIFEKMKELAQTIDNDKLSEKTTFTFYDWEFVEIFEITPAEHATT